jgi:endonuclease-3
LGAAQADSGFTTDPSANRLIECSSNAFLLGVLFTQGIAAERAWAGPWLLQQRLGTLDLGYLEDNPEAVREAFQVAPMLHRFKETLPRWVCSAAHRIRTEYGGQASAIWPSGTRVVDVTERLSEFDGVGRKKAVMAVEILSRHFGVDLVGRECGQVAFDVHVRRVFLRSGIVDIDSVDAVEAAAARACPEAPGTLDLATWLVGRDWCRPKQPRCDACRLGRVCARRITLDPRGVGARAPGRTG